jgi:hypothetical protein
MKPIRLLIFANALLLASTSVFSQDTIQGKVLAYDRMAKILVLTDHTAWSMADLLEPEPIGLKAGDRVEIRYQPDESDVSSIENIVLIRDKAMTKSKQNRVEGTIMVLDLATMALILNDRSIWSLHHLQSELPAGLKSGDRVEIIYESDANGVSSISSIRVLAN